MDRPNNATMTTDMRPGMADHLMSLDDADDFKVADGEPDIRGWDVKATDGTKIGEVKDLLFDRGAMKVRYLAVRLDDKILNARTDRKAENNNDNNCVLFPIGTARLDDDNDNVAVNADVARIGGMPLYNPDRFGADDEVALRNRFATGAALPAGTKSGDLYRSDHYNDRNFFGTRRAGRDDQQYITLSQEELAVGKRQVKAGEVDLHKTVETKHVSKSVPVTHEEVTVERRPLTADAAQRAGASIGDNEVTIPLMAEEVVTEKRTVPVEEVVVSKHAVKENRTVEADLRKEDIKVDRHNANANNANNAPAGAR